MRAAGERVFAVIAGGGTAGHVLPALAIGKALEARGHPAGGLYFVGSERGIEGRLVPAAGFPLTLLPGRGIQRKLTVENAQAAWGLTRATAKATSLLRRLDPRVVVSVGGYASVPCAFAAAAMRIPVVVHEQNAVPGAANRAVARVAKVCAVSFPGTPLPHAELTGNPIRGEVLAVSRNPDGRAAARAALGLPAGRTVVGIVGGSLGALRLNRAVLDALPILTARTDLVLYHVVGERDWDLVTSTRPALVPGGLDYRPVRYEERLPLLLAAADLFVCRSGGSVAELTAVGVPAVLVPFPGATGDHQLANARVLADAGAAVLVPDAELDGARFVAEVDRLIADPARLDAMAKAAAGLGHPDAADRVAALAEEHARG